MSKTWPATSKASRNLFLFGRDLRLGDHAGLSDADRFGEVIPALVVEPRGFARLTANPRRLAYYCGAVASLARDLEARGTRLVCRRGDAIATVLRLAREARVDRVTWSAAYDARGAARGRSLQSALEEAGIRVAIVHDALAVPPDETAAARTADGGVGYRSLSAYLAAWSAQPREPFAAAPRFASHDLVSEQLPSPPQDSGEAANTDAPSETRMRAKLDAYLANAVLHYRSARNVPASGPTSHLSAALSFGVISARTVLHEVDRRARDPFLLTEERASLDDFRRSLGRRDFFLQLAWFFEDEPDAVLQQRMRGFPFARSHASLAAWREGCTGFPLVDAGMRELRATGWMHPRVRSVVASFLCFDLGVDWRVGRDAWDAELVEDDAALANGNWQWAAGVGADLAQFPRIYNPFKQARSFDPSGTYLRRWIPELANAADADILDTNAVQRRRQLALPLFEDARYPAPVLDHDSIARAFLARYAKFKSASAGSTATR
jgi:deoxyribodipyrimidine photo-lyase